MEFPGVALVTGAGSGIGRAVAIQFAADGCQKIAVADISTEGIQQTQEDIMARFPGVSVKAIAVDVRSKESVQEMVNSTIDEFGRLDYCVNSAGVIKFGDTVALSEEDFEFVYQVNLRGTFFCVKAEIAAMLRQECLSTSDSPFPSRGAIVNISSQAGLMGNGNLPSYVASKHGVIGLSKSDGQKFAAQGIRVNALCPGTIDTAILSALPQGEEGERRKKERSAEISMGRIGQASEVAHCAIFLASGRSSFVTATTLAAHGGIRNQ